MGQHGRRDVQAHLVRDVVGLNRASRTIVAVDHSSDRRHVRILQTSDVHLGPRSREPDGLLHRDECVCPVHVLGHLREARKRNGSPVLFMNVVPEGVDLPDANARADMQAITPQLGLR